MSTEILKPEDTGPPLTRTDVEKLLAEVGSSHSLNLAHQNLQDINLSWMNLSGADLSGADLSGAILRATDLTEAKMHNVKLSRAKLVQAKLSRAFLQKANLHQADLIGADLRGAYLWDADLSETELTLANFSGANISGANFSGANTKRATMLFEAAQDEINPKVDVNLAQILYIRIMEEPLTAINLSLILLALSELYTKLWLTAQGRFEDLINFTTTHNSALAEETALVIGRLSHNSPADIEIKLDASPKGVVEALKELVDILLQAKNRKKQLELANEITAAEIERQRKFLEAEIADKDLERKLKEQNAFLELEVKRVKLTQQLFHAQIDLMNLALDTAKKMVEILHPDGDAAARAMAAQSYLKNILELNEAKGLELVLQLPTTPPDDPIISQL